ncbi:MAG: phosphomannomutase [Qingshengfaniella sp.]
MRLLTDGQGKGGGGMAPKFGTSGLRGLVSDLSDDLITTYIRAFALACDHGGRVWLGWDLRPSSPRIAEVVARAAQAAGVAVIRAGAVPTPALALAAQEAGAVMVTGSHIPADRNGLKFYTRQGELTKTGEAALTAALGCPLPALPPGGITEDTGVGARFLARYHRAFGSGVLRGRRIGVYAQSAVGRDLLAEMLAALGAEVLPLGRSTDFVPLDTEAVDPATRAQLKAWAMRHRLDAIAATDGDSDRPLLSDETGQLIPGDLLGQITAETLGAETVVTPVSSNSGVLAKPCFERIIRTQIGSPHVIAGMAQGAGRVLGYEANGGVLLGFAAQGPAGPLPPLWTRDAFLPILTVLVAAGAAPLSVRVAREPGRFTAKGRLERIPPAPMQRLMADLAGDRAARAGFLAALGLSETGLDLTDGVRMLLRDGEVVHVRASGNAPELRLYTEATSPRAADSLLAAGLAELSQRLASPGPGR